jgi:hypothetical protein
MQNIHIQRYPNPAAVHYQGCIAPEDRSWILWIEEDGTPRLWRRVECHANEDGTGDVVEAYMAAEAYDWPPGVPMPDHIARMIGATPLREVPKEDADASKA